jgi:hypothetical protein
MQLDRKSFLIGLLLLSCIAATIPRSGFFTTTSVREAAWTSTGTNIVAQTNAAAVRALLSITNATGLEATDANLVIVSNTVNASVTAQGVLSNAAVLLAGSQTIAGAKSMTNSGNVFVGDGSGLTAVPSSGIETLDGLGTNTVFYSSGTTSSPVRIFGGTQTNSNPADILSTWNAAGVTFTGFRVLITNTAAASDSIIASFGATDMGGGSVPLRVFDRYTRLGAYGAGTSYDARIENVAGGAAIVAYDNSARAVYLDYLGVSLGAGYPLRWWSGAAAGSGAVDTRLDRIAVGVLGTTNMSITNIVTSSLTVGSGAAVTAILSATATLNFDLTAVAVEDLTITVTGAAVGNIVTLGVPNGSVTATAQFTGWVSASDTVTVRCRTAAAGEDPASGTFRATVLKH